MSKLEKDKPDIDEGMVNVSQKELNLLVTNIIPTSKYFELRFDNMQSQINDLKEGQKEIRQEMDKRFEQVDKRFEQVNKRFEQVDKRFDQVDKRFEQIILSIEHLSDKLENRDNNLRSFTMRMFSISILISLFLFKVETPAL